MNIISRLVDIPTVDPDDARRRKVVNILVLFLAALAIVLMLIVLLLVALNLPLPAPLSDPKFIVQGSVGTGVVLVLCGLIYAINRYWSGMIAGLLFTFLTAGAMFFNIPDDPVIGHATFALTISTVCATLFVHSTAGFAMAGMGTIIIAVIGALTGAGFYLASAFDFFGSALLCWFAARSLERALVDLRTLNLELDQRVIERTQELAEALEREQTEASKNQAILEGIADGVIVFDPSGTAIVANPAVTGLLGRPVEEIVDRSIETFMGDGVYTDDREMVVNLLRGSEHEALRPGLKFRWENKTLSVSAAPVRDASGQVIGTVTVFRDFTYEAEIDRMKSTFISIASHELRTPLNAILGYSEMLREGVFGSLLDEQQDAVDRIMAKTGQLLSLANNLLDQAQMEAGRLTLHVTSFAPRDLILDVQGVMEVLAHARDLELTSHIDKDVPKTIHGDRQRLHQILINLIGNAIKFTEEGKVNIRVYIPVAGHWALEVSDTGCGIPPEAQSYIFDPFRRVDDSATRKYGGAGMGLSIVKQLVNLMGGEIWLESEVGQGSTFTILLPLDLYPEEPAAAEETEGSAPI
jgi:PAS domain S-box-containing protein